MFRKVGTAVSVASLAIPTLLVPHAAASADHVDVMIPAPGPDADGDGYETATVRADVDAGVTTVGFGDAPDSLFVHGLAEGAQARVRLRVDGAWGDPFAVTASSDESPDDSAGVSALGPLWIRGADAVELSLADAAPSVSIGALYPTAPPDRGDATSARAAPASAAASASPSFIRPRSDWATSEMGWACSADDLVDVGNIDAAIVHHTAGRNDYTADQVDDVIRSIWHYHVHTRGWCDIAYNLIVDRYGQVWEARQGGIDKAIRGGHTRGFNTGTSGIAQLGDFEAAETPVAVTDATRRLLGWKLGIHHLDPTATRVVVNNSGAEIDGTPDGEEMEIPTILGHRDLGSTACPGDHTYVQLDDLRSGAVLGTQVVALQEMFIGVAEPDAYLGWLALAEAEGLGAVAEDIAYSDAYAGVVVDDLYQAVLGRPADDAGRSHWLAELGAGMRIEKLGAIFYGSKEYVDAAGSTEAWVSVLYDELLHRDAEAEGLAFWIATLDGGYRSAPEIAEGFYSSVESRFDRVVRLYDRFLGRPPDPDGQVYWADQLLDHDDVKLAIFLSLSDESFERAVS